MPIARALQARLETSPLRNRAAHAEARRDRAGGHPVADDPREHLEAALAWLERAHDATADAGVSRGYALAWDPWFRARGWQPSYPETTGYILSTLLEAAEHLKRPRLRERALRMADWEREVQLESGAVQGGVLGEQGTPTPAVFNTGQVILGWLAAHRAGGGDRPLESARRAGDFLLSVQAPDGSFRRRAESRFARADATIYNARAAWSLCALGRRLGEGRYTEAGTRNLDLACKHQRHNGWFAANCLTDPDRPLLHTIAYATRGLLEAGLLLGRDDYVRAAERTALALAGRQRADGGLPGRLDASWSPAAAWDCLTGDAQTAVIWHKLARATGRAELRGRAERITRFVMRSQNRTSGDPGLRGGIKGSFPFDGEYGRFQLLSWAAKFFVDALLLLERPDRDTGAA